MECQAVHKMESSQIVQFTTHREAKNKWRLNVFFSICLVHHTGLKIMANQRTMSDLNGDYTGYTPKNFNHRSCWPVTHSLIILEHTAKSFFLFLSLQNIFHKSKITQGLVNFFPALKPFRMRLEQAKFLWPVIVSSHPSKN